MSGSHIANDTTLPAEWEEATLDGLLDVELLIEEGPELSLTPTAGGRDILYLPGPDEWDPVTEQVTDCGLVRSALEVPDRSARYPDVCVTARDQVICAIGFEARVDQPRHLTPNFDPTRRVEYRHLAELVVDAGGDQCNTLLGGVLAETIQVVVTTTSVDLSALTGQGPSASTTANLSEFHSVPWGHITE